MYNLLNKLFNSPSCDEQDTLMRLQADYVTGRFSTKNNQIQQRNAIVDWMKKRGCDIEMDGADSYTLNGESFLWINVNPINDWSE